MITAAVLIFVLASLAGVGFVVRWEIRRQAKRRAAKAYAEAVARLAVEMEQLAARLGEAFVPAIQRATAAIASFGEALARIHADELTDLDALDEANHARDLRDEHFDNTRWDRD